MHRLGRRCVIPLRVNLDLNAPRSLPVACWHIYNEHGFAGGVALRGQGPAEAALDGDLGLVPAVEELFDGQVEAVFGGLILEPGNENV